MTDPGEKLSRVDFSPESIILDMCMVPGRFLDTVLSINPRETAHAFSLPVEQGVHQGLLSQRPEIVIKPVDITMLVEDMGGHRPTRSFRRSQFRVAAVPR